MKKKEAILEGAVGEHKMLLKIRSGTKYNELFATLKLLFEDSRKKGHRVDFNWLWSKASNIYRLQKAADAVVRKRVITTFIKRNNLKYRRVQRNKNESKEAYREKIQKLRSTMRERLIRTGSSSPSYDPTWSYFKHSQRFNVDQSPLPFTIVVKKTYEIPEKDKKVWVNQPISDARKRFCSLNICFRSEGEQPRVSTIFQGQGKCLSRKRIMGSRY